MICRVACQSALCDYTGGAWPFLVGGLPCQVDSGNERDLSLLNSLCRFLRQADFLEGLLAFMTAAPGGLKRLRLVSVQQYTTREGCDTGDTFKLPGSPARPMVPLNRRKSIVHRGETRGYGKNPSDRDNGQPSPTGIYVPMDAVHRLNGGGSVLMKQNRLKI